MTLVRLISIPLLVMLALANVYAADERSSTAAAVDHLLQYIERSGCVFTRNASPHGAKDAAAHMRKKYEYGKDKIRTPEEFIQYAASRSSVTGKPYLIQCGGKGAEPASSWLTRELSRYRQKKPSK